MTALRLAHAVHGSGPDALVLLHGFLGSGRNLGLVARALAARDRSRRFVTMDLAGHGESPPLPPGADLAALGRDVLETAASLGLAGPFALAGHSLGGRVALAAALAAPGAVGEVVLIDVAPGPLAGRDPAADVALQALLAAPADAADRASVRAGLLAAGVPAATAEWLLMNLARQGERYAWRIDRAALAALRARTDGTDLWPAVEGTPGAAPARARVRVVRGARSGYVTAEDVRRLEAAGAPVQTIPGAGHWVHADRPAELVDALLARPERQTR